MSFPSATQSGIAQRTTERPPATSAIEIGTELIETSPCLAARVAGDVQVGSADVADQERDAAEDKPRLLRPTPKVGDRVDVMGGRVPRCRDRGHERIAELDHLGVAQRNVLELDAGVGW